MKPICIIGGTGMIGRTLASRLVSLAGGQAGAVRIVTRSRRKAQRLWMLPGIEIVEAESLDDQRLESLVRGCSAVVNLVGVLQSRTGKPWGPDFDEAHVRLPGRLSRAMTRAGVRRLVHVSALGAQIDGPSMYLRSKAAGEAALRGSRDLDLTILRPSVVFGPEDQFVNLFARLSRMLPILPLVTPHARFQPIHVEDVVTALVNCLHRPQTIGQTYELGGPEVFTLYEIAHWAGVYSGNPRPILSLPDALAYLQALVFEALPGQPLMSRDNLASASVPNVLSAPMAPELGLDSPTSLHAAAPTFLGGESPRLRLLRRRQMRASRDA